MFSVVKFTLSQHRMFKVLLLLLRKDFPHTTPTMYLYLL